MAKDITGAYIPPNGKFDFLSYIREILHLSLVLTLAKRF